MKTFKFSAHNWKNDFHRGFWFYKDFPSAYAATIYADRISFNRKSQYMVIVEYGKETPSDGTRGRAARRTA